MPLSDVQNLAENLLSEVHVDALTGLHTREGLHRQLAARSATGTDTTLFVLDLDRFKWVNDSAGMQVGDAVLRLAAARILEALAATATTNAFVARLSADEFAILIASDSVELEMVAQRLHATMREPFMVNGAMLTLSASIGIAQSSSSSIDAGELLRCASIALHRAENDGGDSWRCYEAWMLEMASSRQSLEAALREALAERHAPPPPRVGIEQFEVHFQPQVSVERRRLEGFEALVRWRHPSQGLIAPDQFIPLAESTGLIAQLGDWVLRSACLSAVQWPVVDGEDALQVAVNVSPLQLRHRDALMKSIEHALRESGLPPERLEIEITETALNHDALESLEQIKSMGVHLALDDFGSGYSSLSQLAQYPFDRLKIDRSFVRDLRPAMSRSIADHAMRHASHAQWMIQAIASLGAGLRLSTIAEGVETEGQAEIVRQAGVTSIQGFLISKAIPADDVLAWIESFSQMPRAPMLRQYA